MLYELKIFYKNSYIFGIRKLRSSVICFRDLEKAKAEAKRQEKEKLFDSESVETMIKKHKNAKNYIMFEKFTPSRGVFYEKLFPRD